MAEKNTEPRTALEEAAYNKLNRTVGTGTVVRVVGPVVDVKFDGQRPGDLHRPRRRGRHARRPREHRARG